MIAALAMVKSPKIRILTAGMALALSAAAFINMGSISAEIERHRAEKEARSVQVKVPAINPELAKPEALWETPVVHVSAGRFQGKC